VESLAGDSIEMVRGTTLSALADSVLEDAIPAIAEIKSAKMNVRANAVLFISTNYNMFTSPYVFWVFRLVRIDQLLKIQKTYENYRGIIQIKKKKSLAFGRNISLVPTPPPRQRRFVHLLFKRFNKKRHWNSSET